MPELFLVAGLLALPRIIAGLAVDEPAPSPAAQVLMLRPGRANGWTPRPRPWPTLVQPGDGPGSWSLSGFRDDGRKRTLGRDLDLDIARLTSKLAVFDANTDNPLRRSGWETEESVKVPLTGTLFLVGKVGANSESVEQQQYKLIGATGVGLRLPVGGEVQMRHVRQLTNYDPDDYQLVPEQSKSTLELSTRWTLPGQLNLEFTREAITTSSAAGRAGLKRDLRLAIPLANSGQFHIGARYQSPDASTPSPLSERMKIYLGLQLNR